MLGQRKSKNDGLGKAHVHTHTQPCIHLHRDEQTDRQTYGHKYTCIMHTQIHTGLYIFLQGDAYTSRHTWLYIHFHRDAHIYTRVYVCACVEACTHTHTHFFMFINSKSTNLNRFTLHLLHKTIDFFMQKIKKDATLFSFLFI